VAPGVSLLRGTSGNNSTNSSGFRSVVAQEPLCRDVGGGGDGGVRREHVRRGAFVDGDGPAVTKAAPMVVPAAVTARSGLRRWQ